MYKFRYIETVVAEIPIKVITTIKESNGTLTDSYLTRIVC